MTAARRSSRARGHLRQPCAAGRRRHRSHPAGRRAATAPLAWRTTCTPRRSSQPRSSNPVSGPRGATGRARSSSDPRLAAARGRPAARGARAPGSPTPSNRRTSAGTRDRERRRARRAGHDDARVGGVADAAGEHAAVELVEPQRRPTRGPSAARAPAPSARRTGGGRLRRAVGAAGVRRRAPATRGNARPSSRRRARASARRATAPANPGRARAGPRSRCARRRATGSRRHHVAQLFDAGRADAGDGVEVVYRPEGAVRLAPVEDLLRRHGPDAGSASSCSSVALAEAHLRSRTGDGTATPPPPAPRAARAAGMTICWPSATGAARFTSVRSARRPGPPARSSASATRAPSGTRTSPARRTTPTT